MKTLTAKDLSKIKSYVTQEAQLRNEPYNAAYVTDNGDGDSEYFSEYKAASKWYRKHRKTDGFKCGLLSVHTNGKWRVIREDN